MINRILIRTKVVQMLYCYLLTKSEFKINAAPEAPTPDKKFAYSVYLDLLMLVIELSGINAQSPAMPSRHVIDTKLASLRIGRALLAEFPIKDAIAKRSTDIAALQPVVQKLHDKILGSTVYKDFKKKRKVELNDEVDLWDTILESIVTKDVDFINIMKNVPDYSSIGLQRGLAAAQETLRAYYSSSFGYRNALNDLDRSLDRAYDLYASMFALIINLTREQELRLENNKAKYLATAEDKNPNMKFVENLFVEALANNDEIQHYITKNDLWWETDIVLINSLLDSVVSSDIYKAYMADEERSYEKDCEFWRQVLKSIIFPSDDLAESLENKSIFWNDDLTIMGTFVLKTIKQAQSNKDHRVELLPKFKDDEDARFGAELFEDAVKNYDKYRGYIEKFIKNEAWDPDRTAFMDIVIMVTAIAEMLNYPNIPVAVTMNEYVEIANSYSSAKSGQFVNGILYSVFEFLKKEQLLFK